MEDVQKEHVTYIQGKEHRIKHLADKVKATSVTGEGKEKLFRMFNDFPDCFDRTLGQTSLVEHFIDTSSAKPLRFLSHLASRWRSWILLSTTLNSENITSRVSTSLHTLAFGVSFKTMYIVPVGPLTKTWLLAFGTERTTLLFFFSKKDHGNGLQAKASTNCTILQTVWDERGFETMQ